MIEELTKLFTGKGAAEYLGEPVSIGVHMRQAGHLAEQAAARPPLIAAALLHDVGHLLDAGDERHGLAGAAWLARWFGPEVTEPVRLHVAAKRYLCATEPGYARRLSDESVRTLALQGGPMTAAEAEAFASGPYARDAIQVRRWDEAAKEPDAPAPGFAHFAAILADLVRDGRDG